MVSLSFFSSNIPLAVATFVAAITAAFASLRYYSDKAAKVTEFRKAWIESLRQAVAEFSGSTHTIAGRIAIRRKANTRQRAEDLPKIGIIKSLISVFKREAPEPQSIEKELATELLTHWSTLRLSYNKIVLHLNPAEHKAYVYAESAIAEFVSNDASLESLRSEVTNFLHWCILFSEARTNQITKQNFLKIFFKIKLDSDIAYLNSEFSVLKDACKNIDDACIDPGSVLLLSAFATRQLLHGGYESVFKNIDRIEQGIRVVDTSAAIVIKGVWEKIKKGEPAYRRTSNAAIILSFLLIAAVLSSLANTKTPNDIGHANQPLCTVETSVIFPIDNGSKKNATTSLTLNCNRLPAK
jgi:hypothetical protein